MGLSLRRGSVNEKVDSSPQNLFPNDFSDLFFERQIFPWNPELQIQVSMVQAANLNRYFRPPYQMRRLAVTGHTFHNVSLMMLLSFFIGTATVPTSSPTMPAARLAMTAASS